MTTRKTPVLPPPNQYCTLRSDPIKGDYWWVNAKDELHRVDESGIQDAPAVLYQDGRRLWMLNGIRHRLDGPAGIYSDGTPRWFLDHKELTHEKWAADPRVILYNSQTQLGAESWLKQL